LDSRENMLNFGFMMATYTRQNMLQNGYLWERTDLK
jgi:hypothetical protein